MSDRDFIFLYRQIHGNSDNESDDDSDNGYNDSPLSMNDFDCTGEEIEKIRISFEENRKKKTPKKIEKPPPREMTEAELTRQSLEEEKQTSIIRRYISNKEQLVEVLSELNGVNPDDPIFNEFY